MLLPVRGLFDQLADGAKAFGAAEQRVAEARCYAMTLALFRPLRDLLGAEYMRTSALSPRGAQLVQDASRRDRERGGQGRGERGRGDTIASMTDPPPSSRGEDAAGGGEGAMDGHDERRISRRLRSVRRRSTAAARSLMQKMSPQRGRPQSVESSVRLRWVYFMYHRYISCESCSQFDSLPRTHISINPACLRCPPATAQAPRAMRPRTARAVAALWAGAAAAAPAGEATAAAVKSRHLRQKKSARKTTSKATGRRRCAWTMLSRSRPTSRRSCLSLGRKVLHGSLSQGALTRRFVLSSFPSAAARGTLLRDL